MMNDIDTTNMYSHLEKKLFELDAYYLIRKGNRLGPYAVCACGVILMLWISLEWWVFGFSWLPNLYFAFGVLEACTALIYIKAS